MSLKLCLAVFISILIHSVLFFSWSKDKEQPSQGLRSKFKIDLIKVSARKKTPSQGKLRQSKTQSSNNKQTVKGNTKGQQDKYLNYVRETILEKRSYPYAAKTMRLSAVYNLSLNIDSNGNFQYKYESPNSHAIFDEAIENLFESIGKFKTPPKGQGPVSIVFELEFEN